MRKLLDLYAKDPQYVLPKERLNEVASFVKGAGGPPLGLAPALSSLPACDGASLVLPAEEVFEWQCPLVLQHECAAASDRELGLER